MMLTPDQRGLFALLASGNSAQEIATTLQLRPSDISSLVEVAVRALLAVLADPSAAEDCERQV